MPRKPTSKHSPKPKPRRTRKGQFAGKRAKGETISVTVMPPEYAPGAEAPREVADAAATPPAPAKPQSLFPQELAPDYAAALPNSERDWLEYVYGQRKLAPNAPWYRRLWAWLTA
jgi:hypothetical protein